MRIWTKFIQWWKIKWSYKFDKCIICWTCKHKHKGRWLCTSCWDKERIKNPKRKESVLKASKKHSNKYYYENRKVLLLLNKTKNRMKSWKPCLQLMVNWQMRYLPFETLQRPKTTSPEFKIWQQNIKDFQILQEYFKKIIK